MTEQRRFEQVRRHRTRMYRDKGVLGARRVGVNRVGDQFLAGPGFAGDQNGRAAGRHLGHQVQDLQHALAFADDVGEAVALLQGALELEILALQAALRDHALDLDQQLFVVPGLGEVVVGAALECLHREFHRSVSGDHDDWRLVVLRADFLEHLHTALVRHHQVEQNQIVGRLLQPPLPIGCVHAQLHAVILRGEQSFQSLANIRFVVDDQDAASRRFANQHIGGEVSEGLRHQWISLSD